ncbi:MAG: UDP-N-acetylmuramoyl-L-alanyl-D-glutamate--2,6-diaminopimelate ligase [Nitrospira sp.]|nr:UDP-N-acetylmuramoyl-L-alanyl-D-glutamate--2,6-diaminopimelate ligase [Nitrospira sp.]
MKLGELLRGCDYINVVTSNELQDTPSLTLPPRGGGQGWGGDSSLITRHSLLDTDISGVAYDSRKVKDGYLFVAMKGEKCDGHDFINEAIQKGAIVIVHEKTVTSNELQDTPSLTLPPRGGGQGWGGDSSLSFIRVKNSRKSLACIANNFHERPSEHLALIGITGTNGKTTTTYILKTILELWGKGAGLIGTIQYMIKDRVYLAPHTTPESLEFQALLQDMVLSGCTHVISEVSSHALAQYRVDGARFKTAVFTNLTRDHLDFHKTMEEYFKAKVRLFTEILDREGTAIINIDDPYGVRLYSEIRTARLTLRQAQGDALNMLKGKRGEPVEPSPKSQNSNLKKIITYGLQNKADIRASDIDHSFSGSRFTISFEGKSYEATSHLMGLQNVYNIMSAAGAAVSLEVPWEIIMEGIRKTTNVRGRFERVDLGQDFLCIIDYAHTEDALERLINTARELIKKSEVRSQKSEVRNTPSLTLPPRGGGQGWGGDSELRAPNSSSRIITVFGCGGDRDQGKRPKMGEMATRLSDFVIITSDNPRSEEPLEIIRDIERGAVRGNYLIEPDRAEAIRKAVNMAGNGDIILIAGKGHEDYQEIKGIRYRFNDREVLEKILKDTLHIQNVK